MIGPGDLCRRGLHRLTVDTMRIVRPRHPYQQPYVVCALCLAARPKSPGNKNPIRNPRRATCKAGHPLEGENLIEEHRRGKIERSCKICRRRRSREGMRALRLRRGEKMLPVKPEGAVAFVRSVLAGARLNDHDAEDLASAAYLAYWRSFIRTGNGNPASFYRDVLDAYSSFCRNRRKTPTPKIFTNAADAVFDRA